MKLLFIGETHLGSSARSLKESLRRAIDVQKDEIDELNEDSYFPKHRNLWLRIVHKILRALYKKELYQAFIKKCDDFSPDILLVYKGTHVDIKLIQAAKSRGVFTVNVFPDYSPHAYGAQLRQVLGEYDLVISTKPFHAGIWQSIYGYNNLCDFVPHGYDAFVHLRNSPATVFDYDVGLAANWRPEYHDLMRNLADLLDPTISVAIAGHGWVEKADEFPEKWKFVGPVVGLRYSEWMQRCKIMIAPVNREVVIDGKRQPGDEDTTRSYELAAAYCFFIHRRTDYITAVYDENAEVPLFETEKELSELIHSFLPEEELRFKMAAAAHARAVPAYSIDNRAKQVWKLIREYANSKGSDNS